MDIYEQKLPQTESEFVSYKDSYQNQTADYTAPSYDSYIVNAQGLGGMMMPRLLENGTLLGRPEEVEIEKSDDRIVSATSTSMFYGQNLPGVECDFFHIGMPAIVKEYDLEKYIKNWNTVTNSRKFTNSYGSIPAGSGYLNPNESNSVNFYFENNFSSNLIINPSTSSSLTSSFESTIGDTSNKFSNRQYSSNYIESYTNAQIATGRCDFLEAKNGEQIYNRTTESGYSPNAIGAYKITTPDGKTYHYSMPVYQYEQIYRQRKANPEEINNQNIESKFFSEYKTYREERRTEPYATHWVLTAITGPDFYDVNGNHIADQDDYGYWVRFDYGKWTEGYTWRSPYTGYNDYIAFANYNDTPNAAEYAWGRKQLVYLNKVVTRTHTALFIKSVRHDSMGKKIGNNTPQSYTLLGYFPFYSGTLPTFPGVYPYYIGAYPSYEGDSRIYYPMQRTLKLDEIILLRNQEAGSVLTNNQYQSITPNPSQLHTVDWKSPINKNFQITSQGNNSVQYKINMQENVLDNGDLQLDENGKYIIYKNAIRIIKLNQDYSLATGSPHSDAPATSTTAAGGRLTLNGIKTYGRGMFDYMPATTFDYFDRNIGYIDCSTNNCSPKNPWGYHKDNPKMWSLQRITTPTGAKIEFELEKDTYWTEAFSRRYWTEDLMFIKTGEDSNYCYIQVKKRDGSNIDINFSEYFMPSERVFLDLFIHKRDRWWSGAHKREANFIFNLLGTSNCMVMSVDQNTLNIRTPNAIVINDDDIGSNCWFARGNSPSTIGSNNGQWEDRPRGDRPETPSPGIGQRASHHTMYYNLLANKVPGEGTGGGLRVKSITAIDEVNNRYVTEYNYNHPTKPRTTGITSFAPVRGLKYVPYQTEIPSPRVMYEYVTVTEKQTNGGIIQTNGKTIYQFNVLENADNIFSKNLKEGEHFRTTVITNNELNSALNLKSESIKIEDNTSVLGSIVSVTRYNNQNQIISKSQTKRRTLDELKEGVANNTIKGAIQESFQSSKSIYRHDAVWQKADVGISAILFNHTKTQKCFINSTLTSHSRLLNYSTKITYPNSIKYTEDLGADGAFTRTWNEDQDPVNGLFNTTITSKSNGKLYRVERVPAYTKYPEMGSKVTNFNNKNMLTQEAMVVSSIQVNNVWKTTNASITTWNNNWNYRNEETGLDVAETIKKVWRKHKTFVWKDNLAEDGTLATPVSKTNDYFNWTLGVPTANAKWQKASEITRYNRWSSPLETKDINGNFASTKMGDSNTKVLVSGNARYTEMYYSGAEYVKSDNLFDGEVKGANYRTDEVAHTGSYSVKAQNTTDKVFEVTGRAGANNYYTNQDAYSDTFRPGKYKVSFWAYKSQQDIAVRSMTATATSFAKLTVNGIEVPYAEIVDAGCWQLHNYIVDLQPNTNYIIAVNSRSITGQDYFDDFRMHPVASTVASYVYDKDTDMLSYMLDGNNIGSAYKYDPAGRLIATYSEMLDHNSFVGTNVTGGFKLVSQHRQKYKGATDVINDAPQTLTNCLSNYPPIQISISNECIASFENKFKTQVTGGSGNFSYAYKWMTNQQEGTFTNFVSGSSTMYIPYVPIYTNATTFNKLWSFVVKVTDTTTGEVMEETYEYTNTQDFEYIPSRNWADLEITKCNEFCGANNYAFRVHLVDIGLQGNFKYEYATYNPNQMFYTQNLNWIDVTASKGKFCPTPTYVSDATCKSGCRKIYYLTYRITNLDTGEVSVYTPQIFMGDCAIAASPLCSETMPEKDREYLTEGYLLIKDETGSKLLEVIDLNRILK